MLDRIITGGTVVDGTGGSPFTGDVGIRDGRIVEVGGRITEAANERIDADGALVTPGWVDVHTHYDGQVSWDEEMAPSSQNGVTTVVMGNCGVGFAPVRAGGERELIELMEGVEDIPGSALHEGMEWGRWETFPEYLDYLDGRRFALDVGAQIAHGAVRYYAMGERGRQNEDATAEDLSEMGRLVEEAIGAGAVGFSTSRTVGHRSLWGTPVPGTFAADEELLAIAEAMRRVGKGVFEMIPSGTVGELKALGGEKFTQEQEHDLMRRFSLASGRPVTFTLVQSPDFDPDLWREILRLTEEANGKGARLFPQVSSRPIGFVSSLSSYHAFMRRPTYLSIAHLPVEERARGDGQAGDPGCHPRRRRHPTRGSRLDGERLRPVHPGRPGVLPAGRPRRLRTRAGRHPRGQGGGGRADPIEFLYDWLIADGGSRFLSLSAIDQHARMEVLREMQLHPDTVTGLSDAGAHVTLICDGTMPTTQISFWTRDRTRGEQLPLEHVVNKQTLRNAQLYGLDDRGSIEVGMRADLNVIDHDRIAVDAPVAHADLPAGGTRLLQPVRGYVATLCHGEVTRRHDADTGARPGRLVRS